MKWLDTVRAQTLSIVALIALFVAATMASPYLPHTALYAQQTGTGGVPGGNSGGAVSSVFGRTGAVVTATADYACSQVTNCAGLPYTNTFTASNSFTGNTTTFSTSTAGVGIPAIIAQQTTQAATVQAPIIGQGYLNFEGWRDGTPTEQWAIGYGAQTALGGNNPTFSFTQGGTTWTEAWHVDSTTGNTSFAANIITPNVITQILGSGTSSNTDLRGHLTLASGSATYTFIGTYTLAPTCVATDTTSAAAVKASATTTVLTLTGTGTDILNYICID